MAKHISFHSIFLPNRILGKKFDDINLESFLDDFGLDLAKVVAAGGQQSHPKQQRPVF